MSHGRVGEGNETSQRPRPAEKSSVKGRVGGRKVTNKGEIIDNKKFAGLIVLVLAAIAVIFSCILASGVFGGGIKAYIGAGLAVAAMVGVGIGLYLVIPRHDPSAIRDVRTGKYSG